MKTGVVYYVVAIGVGLLLVNFLTFTLGVNPLLACLIAAVVGILAGATAAWWIGCGRRR